MIKQEIHPKSKKNAFIKFLLVLIVIILYFVFMSYKYGFKHGFATTLLTWSFFIFCTPIADAGFILDFPIRLITGLRMVYSEIIVWIIGILINFFYLLYNPEIYKINTFLHVFKHILLTPYPYWIIIILSCAGTFFSIIFADEVLDEFNHKKRKKFQKHHWKYKLIILISITILIILSYYILIKKLGINIL